MWSRRIATYAPTSIGMKNNSIRCALFTVDPSPM
jgi:hypothetical protein